MSRTPKEREAFILDMELGEVQANRQRSAGVADCSLLLTIMNTILELEDSFKYKHVSMLPRLLIISKGDEYVDSYGYVMKVTNVIYVKDKKRALAKTSATRTLFGVLNKARNSNWTRRNQRQKQKA